MSLPPLKNIPKPVAYVLDLFNFLQNVLSSCTLLPSYSEIAFQAHQTTADLLPRRPLFGIFFFMLRSKFTIFFFGNIQGLIP